MRPCEVPSLVLRVFCFPRCVSFCAWLLIEENGFYRLRISPQTSKRSTALGRSPPIASQKMPKKASAFAASVRGAEVLQNWRPGRWSTRSLRTEAACHCVPVLLIKMLTLAPCRPRLGCLSPRPSRASVSEDASSLVGIKWPAPLSCAAAKGQGCFRVDKELAKGASAARPGTSRKGACGGALDSKKSDNLRPGSFPCPLPTS